LLFQLSSEDWLIAMLVVVCGAHRSQLTSAVTILS
jgi:hypothetical protein